MRYEFRLLICMMLVVALSALHSPKAIAASKLAFVVGVDRYDNLAPDRQLQKAVNDARAVDETLSALGFEVTRVEDAGRIELVRQWQRFLNRLEPGDTAAFFFAGHGVELDGPNYLLPRDVPEVVPGEKELLKAAALPLNGFLSQLRDRRVQISLAIVDACRDNPFTDARGRSLGGTRGLGRIEAPEGSFVMFSAATGQTALDRLGADDPDPNSVFTRSLVRHLATPELELTDIAREVRREVRSLARSVGHDQRPAYYDEVTGRFCPAGCVAPEMSTPDVDPPETPAPGDLAAGLWFSIEDTTSEEVLEAFLEEFPDGLYAALARERLRDLRAERAARRERLRRFTLTPQVRDSNWVNSVTFSPNGARLASGSMSNTIRLWDAETGRLIRTFEGHSRRVSSVVFSPDGARLASGSYDKTIRLWDAETGRLLRIFEGHSGQVRSVAFSPSGTWLASGSQDRTVRLWEAASKRLLRTFTAPISETLDRQVNSVAFSRAAVRIVSGNEDGTIQLRDIETGKLLRTFQGHSILVNSVAYSPEGNLVASGGADNTVKLWAAVRGGELLRTFEGHSGAVYSVAFSPDGLRLASGSGDKTVRLWDAVTGRLLRTLEGHSGGVSSIAFSPDGARLVSGSRDSTIRIWNVANGRHLATLRHLPDDQWIAISPDGSYTASAGAHNHLVLSDGSETQSVSEEYKAIFFRPEGLDLSAAARP